LFSRTLVGRGGCSQFPGASLAGSVARRRAERSHIIRCETAQATQAVQLAENSKCCLDPLFARKFFSQFPTTASIMGLMFWGSCGPLFQLVGSTAEESRLVNELSTGNIDKSKEVLFKDVKSCKLFSMVFEIPPIIPPPSPLCLTCDKPGSPGRKRFFADRKVRRLMGFHSTGRIGKQTLAKTLAPTSSSHPPPRSTPIAPHPRMLPASHRNSKRCMVMRGASSLGSSNAAALACQTGPATQRRDGSGNPRTTVPIILDGVGESNSGLDGGGRRRYYWRKEWQGRWVKRLQDDRGFKTRFCELDL
jgi:hypothetical protein